ncbi:hypothetical protein FOZ60_001445 [Perkinsus olseni]|uniref:Uncharacterized protein n=1 Tax=Perkinsus olseni TaxID=32597 RepID=A0A7J6PL57_PEROL|nr:hypothetical protein FOZ60_001445 [Perkinsus olseni]
MPQHRQIPFLSLTLLLALQGEAARCHRSPVFVGKSVAGTRYYFEPLTEDGSFYAERLERRTVDGFYCEHRAYGQITSYCWLMLRSLLPNGVYYGFNEDGVEATVEFDGTSQLTSVKLDASNQGRYNEFIYAMAGKAIRGSFYKDRNSSDAAHLLLEPVDREKFDGSRKSFPHARLNTIEGWPFAIERLADLLNTKSKLKVIGSRVVRRLSYLRNPISRFNRHGKDGLKNSLLGEDHAEECVPDHGPGLD